MHIGPQAGRLPRGLAGGAAGGFAAAHKAEPSERGGRHPGALPASVAIVIYVNTCAHYGQPLKTCKVAVLYAEVQEFCISKVCHRHIHSKHHVRPLDVFGFRMAEEGAFPEDVPYLTIYEICCRAGRGELLRELQALAQARLRDLVFSGKVTMREAGASNRGLVRYALCP